MRTKELNNLDYSQAGSVRSFLAFPVCRNSGYTFHGEAISVWSNTGS
jgi:hypothetical protein